MKYSGKYNSVVNYRKRNNFINEGVEEDDDSDIAWLDNDWESNVEQIANAAEAGAGEYQDAVDYKESNVRRQAFTNAYNTNDTDIRSLVTILFGKAAKMVNYENATILESAYKTSGGIVSVGGTVIINKETIRFMNTTKQYIPLTFNIVAEEMIIDGDNGNLDFSGGLLSIGSVYRDKYIWDIQEAETYGDYGRRWTIMPNVKGTVVYYNCNIPPAAFNNGLMPRSEKYMAFLDRAECCQTYDATTEAAMNWQAGLKPSNESVHPLRDRRLNLNESLSISRNAKWRLNEDATANDPHMKFCARRGKELIRTDLENLIK